MVFHCFFPDDHLPLGLSSKLGRFSSLIILVLFLKHVIARLVHEKVKAMFSNFTINAHPMAIMVPMAAYSVSAAWNKPIIYVDRL